MQLPVHVEVDYIQLQLQPRGHKDGDGDEIVGHSVKVGQKAE